MKIAISFIALNLLLGCQNMKLSEKENAVTHLKYFEEVDSEQSLQFAVKQNEIVKNRLKADPRFKSTYEKIFNILSDEKNLPQFFQLGHEIYNFWQDKNHIKGILRKTSISNFNSPQQNWITILDLDLLSKNENENWVFGDINCLSGKIEYCMISLSKSGKDAHVSHEFNLKTGQFVKNGFTISESKSHLSWLDENTLIIADGTIEKNLNKSGYPTEIKILKRGEILTQATTVFKADKTDASLYLLATGSIEFQKKNLFINRYITFGESENYIYDIQSQKTTLVSLPEKSQFIDILGHEFIFQIRKPFLDFPSGSLISFSLNQSTTILEKRDYHPIFIPDSSHFCEDSRASKNYLWVVTNHDVIQSLHKYEFQNNQWIKNNINLPKGSLNLQSVSSESDHVYIDYTDFLTPVSYFYMNEKVQTQPIKIKQAPSRFDSSKYTYQQFKTKSKDGTMIPYFIVHSKDNKISEKSNPVLLYAYGGFEVSINPSYVNAMGPTWLEKGGIYVLANIRGGSEYGTEWHTQIIKENRHKVYEDFYAVAEDLIHRKITTPKQLGIKGGSNGGLLTAVALTQRPELFNAVISVVPLTNMLDYHQLFAGASWMNEYGNPADPKMKDYLLSYSPLHNLDSQKNTQNLFLLLTPKMIVFIRLTPDKWWLG